MDFLRPNAKHLSFQRYPATPDFSESALAGHIVDREDGVVRQLSAPGVAKVSANAVVSDNHFSRKVRVSSWLIQYHRPYSRGSAPVPIRQKDSTIAQAKGVMRMSGKVVQFGL